MTELPRLGVGGRGGGVCEPVRLWQRCAAALAMISSCLSWSQSSRLGEGGGSGGRDGAAPRRSVSLQYAMARATASALSLAVSSAAHLLGDGGDPLGFLEFRNRREIFRRYLRAPVALVSRGPRRHASWMGARAPRKPRSSRRARRRRPRRSRAARREDSAAGA